MGTLSVLGLGVTRFLPVPCRRLVIDVISPQLRTGREGLAFAALRRAMQAPGRRRRFAGRHVLVAGLLSSPSGLGRGARLMIAELRARGTDVVPVDLTVNFNHPVERPYDGAITPRQALAHAPTDLLIHLNPPEYVAALRLFPRPLLRQVAVIGHWVWELDRTPALWARCAAITDEIWVPSAFVEEALRAGGCPPSHRIRIVPYQVDRDPARGRDLDRGRALRAAYGIAPETFVAGAAWSMMSGFARKGAQAAIAAFQRAFPDLDGPQSLLLRCPDGAAYPEGLQQLRDAAASDPRIMLLGGADAPLAMADFYDMIDVYLSLTRGEGYGLTIAEASQAGLPVLATGWGLSSDLADRPGVVSIGFALRPVEDPQHRYDAVPGAVWAEPDPADAAHHLRALALAHSHIASSAH